MHGGFSQALELVLAGCVICGWESTALKLKTWILPLATVEKLVCTV